MDVASPPDHGGMDALLLSHAITQKDVQHLIISATAVWLSVAD